jgi:coenzyme PQQ synthesis protein D (PqqD)
VGESIIYGKPKEGLCRMTATMNSTPNPLSIMAGKARVPPHVVYRAFAQETVVLNLDTGRYHGLNPTAGHMLEALDRAATVGAAAERLAKEYAQAVEQIERDLYTLCVDLRARGLLEIDGVDSD